MTKTPKIHVLTVKLTCHIPVDPGDFHSVQDAARVATALHAHAAEKGQTSIETRLNRVPAPEPKAEASEPEPEALQPAADNLDGPFFLDRTDPKMAAAE